MHSISQAQLGVLGHLALHEQGAHLGVEPGGQEERDDLPGLVPELRGVLGEGEGVEVDHAVEGVVGVLVLDPARTAPR